MTKLQLIVTADGSHTLAVPHMNETYHSTHGAIQESLHIFINQGLDFWYKSSNATSARVFEVGFGTGLNCLLSAVYAKNHQKSIRYHAIESYPIQAKEALMLNYPELVNEPLAKQWFEKMHQASWDTPSDISGSLELLKIQGQIQDFQSDNRYDICYFDAFAPSKQPEMWDITVLEKIEKSLDHGGVFITYCAAGHLKRSLKSLGLAVEVLPGPPGKNQIVRAIKK